MHEIIMQHLTGQTICHYMRPYLIIHIKISCYSQVMVNFCHDILDCHSFYMPQDYKKYLFSCVNNCVTLVRETERVKGRHVCMFVCEGERKIEKGRRDKQSDR
ncbi:hypothetical protein EGW08_011679 [Elysia chlorotica]|uniref:Uncharacterized protein n=1 Tax=Elysia chlorotica TaxID=188477 RepID=A0A433TG80_ELYCH|nr:hypothetical protein EGW08_011679 [Elysia chlorotica]